MAQAVKIIVSGQVQGVGFRWATKQVAENLGVTGYVINLINGHVKIIAQATSEVLRRFISAIKASPTPYGHVSNVEIHSIPTSNYSFFNVK